MDLDTNHFNDLKKSYNLVGTKIHNQNDFFESDLKVSQSFFTEQSMINGKPEPINVDVYAVLSGIKFDGDFILFVEMIKRKILEVVSNNYLYLVDGDNLGVEYAVIKWPNDEKDEKKIIKSKDVLSKLKLKKFYLNIFGIQIHPDGCIVLKGVDENQSIFKARKKLISEIDNIPKKQSSWCHIPLGRFLLPIGDVKMTKLKNLISEIDSNLNYNLLIEQIHLVHEKQWYMKKKDILYTLNLK